MMPTRERIAAREVAVELRDELARLDLVAALATRLLQPGLAARSRSGSQSDVKRFRRSLWGPLPVRPTADEPVPRPPQSRLERDLPCPAPTRLLLRDVQLPLGD